MKVKALGSDLFLKPVKCKGKFDSQFGLGLGLGSLEVRVKN